VSGTADPEPAAEPPRRQAPRYGEYATPEEVAALRGPDAEPLVPPTPQAAPPPAGAPIPGAPPAGHRRPATWDAILTLALLAFGAFNIVQSAIGYLDLPSFLHDVLQAGGYGDIDVPASVRPWGYVLIAVDVVVYLGGIWLSVHRIRRGRVAVWVPLVAAVAAATIGAIVILTVLAGSGTLDVLQNQG
jgi:hypothetical protein